MIFLKLKQIVFAICSILFIGARLMGAANASPSVAQPIKIVSFNILAPCWASPNFYPKKVHPYLDRITRRKQIINFLQSKPTTDIFTLQEVTQIEFNFIKKALQKNYMAFHSLHAPTYWSNWITTNTKWEPNGNAIFLKKSRFTKVSFKDIALSQDGNHAALADATDQYSHKKIRAVSIHLDADGATNRKREFKALMDLIPMQTQRIDIISGDFNVNIKQANFHNEVIQAHLLNTLDSFNIREATLPKAKTEHEDIGVIDNVLIRNSRPQEAAVINFGLFKAHPHPKDVPMRLINNLRIAGSDHFPVEATILIG